MRPSLREAVGVALTPEYVSAVTVAAGWRRRLKDQHRVDCQPAGADRVWKPAMEALRALLPTMQARSGDTTVTLSNRFVRYVVAAWQDQLTDPDMEIAFARHCFRQVYGSAADGWDIRVSPGPAGQPRIASALDVEFMAELRDAFAGSSLKVRSIQPHLMAAYNRWRRRLDPKRCLFVVAEERFYTCMAFVNGECTAVHSGAFDGLLGKALPIILDREFVRSGMEERPAVFVYAPEEPPGTVGRVEAWGSGGRELRDESAFAASLDPVYRTAAVAL